MNSIRTGLALFLVSSAVTFAADGLTITSGRGGNSQSDVALYTFNDALTLTPQEVRELMGLPKIDPTLELEGKQARTTEERVAVLRKLMRWSPASTENVLQVLGEPDEILHGPNLVSRLVYYSNYRDPLDFGIFPKTTCDTMMVVVHDGVVSGWQLANLPKNFPLIYSTPWSIIVCGD